MLIWGHKLLEYFHLTSLEELVYEVPGAQKGPGQGFSGFGGYGPSNGSEGTEPNNFFSQADGSDFFSGYAEYMRKKSQKRPCEETPPDETTEPNPPDLDDAEGGLEDNTFTADLGLGEGIIVKEVKNDPSPHHIVLASFNVRSDVIRRVMDYAITGRPIHTKAPNYKAY